MIRILSAFLLAVAIGLFGSAGCGEQEPPINEKITRANADRIVVDKTTLAEAEQILGPGVDYPAPDLEPGLKAKRWERGKDGEEITVKYEDGGRIVSVEFVDW